MKPGKMNKLTGSQIIESVANSYRIDMAACREANDMLTKENKQLRAKLAALTAAAEAVGPNPVLFLTKQLADKQRQLDATIERCAQIADQGADITPDPVACVVAEKIAAAIRAIKRKG